MSSQKEKPSVHKLKKKIEKTLIQLSEETDEAKVSQQMIDFFNFSSQFHQYSANNLWLIYCQKPDATRVMGFNAWKKVGRWVCGGKGCGIAIFAPHAYKEIDEAGKEVKRTGFHVTYVYDVSDTEGQPLPEPPNWKSPQKQKDLEEELIKFAESKNIKVEITPLTGETQGVSLGGVIRISPKAGTKTFVHEIAHELMHQGAARAFLEGKTLELEAEATAYVVAKHFGIENLNSPNYIALHHNSGEDILSHMTRIRDVSHEIISAISPNSCLT